MVGTVGFVQDAPANNVPGPWRATYSGASTGQAVVAFPIGPQPPHLRNFITALQQARDIVTQAWPGCGGLWDLLDNNEPITCTIRPHQGLAHSTQFDGNRRVECLTWCLGKL